MTVEATSTRGAETLDRVVIRFAGDSGDGMQLVGDRFTELSAAFGLGFAGIIPSYSVAVRDLFPGSEASWRMPLTLFTAMSGMAAGSWFAGFLYDHFGYYAPAFTTGIIFNVVNLAIIGFLVVRLTGGRWVNPYAAVS